LILTVKNLGWLGSNVSGVSLKVDRELIFILFVVILYSDMGDDELDEVELDLFIFIESS
jgi:hypothetical protein